MVRNYNEYYEPKEKLNSKDTGKTMLGILLVVVGIIIIVITILEDITIIGIIDDIITIPLGIAFIWGGMKIGGG